MTSPRRLRLRRPLTLALAALFGAWACERGPEPVGEVPAEEALVVLDFQGVEVRVVVDTLARAMGRSVIYEKGAEGRVTVITPRPVPLDTAYAVVESSLRAAGLDLVERPDGVLAVRPSQTKRATVPDPARPETRDLFSQARLLPVWRDGRMVGIRVTAIESGGFFAGLGLEEGDVITEANGIRVESPERSAEVLLELAEARVLEVTIDREGETRSLRLDDVGR